MISPRAPIRVVALALVLGLAPAALGAPARTPPLARHHSLFSRSGHSLLARHGRLNFTVPQAPVRTQTLGGMVQMPRQRIQSVKALNASRAAALR